MTSATRIFLILLLMLPCATGLIAQETATATPTDTSGPTATVTTTFEPETTGSRERVLMDFVGVVNRHPRELGTILALDPTLLSNQPFLSRYPDLAQFVAQHPQVRRNPHYYLRNFSLPSRRQPSVLEEVLEPMMITFVFVLIAFALGWLVRTIIEQKRWNQLSRRQSDVHNKILDRFSSSEELLEYIRSAAGTKFLESAPIPLHTEPTRQSAPVTRVMWSIQIGVIVAAAGLGMLLVSTRFDGDTAHGFFAMGVIAASIGAGFIASSIVSIALSRRLGIWQDAGAAPPEILDESRLVK